MNASSNKPSQQSTFNELVDDIVGEQRERLVPIYIAAVAALLALVSLINDNTERAAFRAHLEASNQFAYFQAKNIRMTDAQIAAQTLEALDRSQLAKKWADKAKRYNAEKR